jgi:hypothetical protein
MKTKYRLPSESIGALQRASFRFTKKRSSCNFLRFLIALLLVFLADAVSAQDQVVTGKITDAVDGQPLPGVNVAVKGTSKGTITDVAGNYTISLSGDDKALIP